MEQPKEKENTENTDNIEKKEEIEYLVETHEQPTDNSHKLPDKRMIDEILFDIYITNSPEYITQIINNLLIKGIKKSKRGIPCEPRLEMQIHNNLIIKGFDQLCYEFFDYKLSKTSEDLLSIIGNKLKQIQKE
jgi:hypothetical protein